MFIVNLIRGFFMALADSVPGVSGGTIAFILGFYDEFIGSLNTLVSKNSKEEKIQALQFLLKIGVGWAIGMITSVLFLASIFEEHIYSISSVFIGFIIFSIPLIIKAEKETIKNKYLNIVWTITGILVVVAITVFNPVAGGTGFEVSWIDFICIYCWNDCHLSYGFTRNFRINFIVNFRIIYNDY